jgi:hypothetical protein
VARTSTRAAASSAAYLCARSPVTSTCSVCVRNYPAGIPARPGCG